MKSKYYRLTCVGIGIYEYLKKYIWNNYQEPVKVWMILLVMIMLIG